MTESTLNYHLRDIFPSQSIRRVSFGLKMERLLYTQMAAFQKRLKTMIKRNIKSQFLKIMKYSEIQQKQYTVQSIYVSV